MKIYLLSLFIFAGYRMIPAVQEIFLDNKNQVRITHLIQFIMLIKSQGSLKTNIKLKI